ncbi:zinc metallochaperone AztD [Gordonia sp. CPCC 206044]|uniref:zinc metallochaperone AztD n=1 Tax=Gordonia sp. CPCC 206044 TaxID=3140793 RepID=UPI003AF34538
MQSQRTNLTRTLALLIASSCALVACGTDTDPGAAESAAGSSSSASPVEQQSATPRLALSYDGGILVLDADDLSQVADIPTEGFIRLNDADNGRNVFVSQTGGFGVLDMGTWTRQHGDHGHYYTQRPEMTDMRFGGEEPGHVVPHDSRITLFSDGTGEVDIVEPAELLQGNAKSTAYTVPEPHHGVAVSRGDGTLVVTSGNEEQRSGIVILDKARKEIARNDQCPEVHGEAAAADGALTFGCQDGILIVRGNQIQKVQSPDGYGRIGNQAGSEASPIVLGDYKTDADAELERPNRFTFTDTRTGELRVVPFPASYSFRSLERGPNGSAVILGTDGALYVYDPATAQQIRKIPAIGAWTEPDEWQSAMPNLYVRDEIAYISDPTAKSVTAIDLDTGEKTAQADLPHETIELTGVSG